MLKYLAISCLSLFALIILGCKCDTPTPAQLTIDDLGVATITSILPRNDGNSQLSVSCGGEGIVFAEATTQEITLAINGTYQGVNPLIETMTIHVFLLDTTGGNEAFQLASPVSTSGMSGSWETTIILGKDAPIRHNQTYQLEIILAGQLMNSYADTSLLSRSVCIYTVKVDQDYWSPDLELVFEVREPNNGETVGCFLSGCPMCRIEVNGTLKGLENSFAEGNVHVYALVRGVNSNTYFLQDTKAGTITDIEDGNWLTEIQLQGTNKYEVCFFGVADLDLIGSELVFESLQELSDFLEVNEAILFHCIEVETPC